MNEIKVVLLCSSRFAIPALQEMIFFNQLAVIVVPSYCEEMKEEVQAVLTGSSIPLLLVHKDDFAVRVTEVIEKYAVNMGLVMTFPYKIPAAVYSLPGKGFFNVHPGPLPSYRGADPVFQQIRNKEEKAGVTIHKLDEGLDTGPVVIKEMIRLEKTDTHGLLTSKLAQAATLQIRVLMKLAAFGIAIPSRLQDETKAVYYKRQVAKDISINWASMDADAVIALINACNPWNKGAVTRINNKIIRLLEAEKLPGSSFPEAMAGTVIEIDECSITVATINKGAIKVHIVYIDEGFLSAGRLSGLGVLSGNKFGMI